VDPYYLAQKAQAHGYFPEIILAGRKMNDSMGEHVSSQLVKMMVSEKALKYKKSNVLGSGIYLQGELSRCQKYKSRKRCQIIRYHLV
jgi:UDP-N-acetyl-D-galactosamine dehydrogenase